MMAGDILNDVHDDDASAFVHQRSSPAQKAAGRFAGTHADAADDRPIHLKSISSNANDSTDHTGVDRPGIDEYQEKVPQRQRARSGQLFGRGPAESSQLTIWPLATVLTR
ncbi:hypothetical protein [Rhizobium leguminosarum]|uniref:hypothetical protein n=1 Tax=Rhizobium leguminosarum TaxID=384 RepID=UPI0021BBFBBC|nr:hypothetical protein [Rhizobium leguminosarum]